MEDSSAIRSQSAWSLTEFPVLADGFQYDAETYRAVIHGQTAPMHLPGSTIWSCSTGSMSCTESRAEGSTKSG